MASSLSSLDRWHSAGLIDSQTVESIRRWEEIHPAESRRWLIYLALAFGAVLLASGVFLFVSAHWDNMSPWGRFSLVIASVAALHLAGAVVADQFPFVSIGLHSAGTLALGGAIALTGQIFHLSEHWPAGIMLWALGAVVGWMLLHQWPQLAMAAILIPWWLAGEWWELNNLYSIPIAVALLALSLVYLSAHRGPKFENNAARHSLVWVGGLYLFPAGIAAGVDRWRGVGDETQLLACWLVTVAICLGISVWLRGTEFIFVTSILAWVFLLCLIRVTDVSVLMYAWYLVGSCLLAWWGHLEARPERINLGVAAFALTVICFYFSNVMDKLGRSASLIILGLVFLGGGWALEQTRRSLIARMTEVQTQ